MFLSVRVCSLWKIKRKMQTTTYTKPLPNVLFTKWALHTAAVKCLSFQHRQLVDGRVCLLLARGVAREFLARVICFSIYRQTWHVQIFNNYFYNLKTDTWQQMLQNFLGFTWAMFSGKSECSVYIALLYYALWDNSLRVKYTGFSLESLSYLKGVILIYEWIIQVNWKPQT